MSNPVIKHQKNVTIPDGADTDVVRPSDWNADHQITQTTGRLLGRVTAGTGPTEELTPEQGRGLLALGTAALVDASGVGSGDLARDIQARADIASATTTDIGAESTQYLRVTGTTTIAGLGTAAAGVVRDLLFADALTLTHNATSLINITGANIVTAAGDIAQFRSEGSGNWRMTGYQRASGRPLSFAPDYDSGQLTITSGGILTLSMGFTFPSIVQTWLRCITAQGEYSAGDELMIDRQMANTTNHGVSVFVGTDGVVRLTYGSATQVFYVLNRISGNVTGATNANWRLIVRAWK